MKRITQSPLVDGSRAIRSRSSPKLSSQLAQRCLHRSPPKPATVAPITASGPPPTAPIPSAEHVDSRIARRRQQAELLKKGQDLRAVASGKGGGTAKMKRFWKDVHVKKVDGSNLPLLFPILENRWMEETLRMGANNMYLQKDSKSTSTNAHSVAQPKTSSQSPFTNHTSHPP